MEQRSPIPWCDRRRTYCASGCTVRGKLSNSGACDWESRISTAPYVPSPGDYEPQPRSLQHPPQQRPQHQNNGQQGRNQDRNSDRSQDQQTFRSKYGPNQNHKKGRNGQQQRPNANQNQQRGQPQNGAGNGNGEAPPAGAPAADAVQQPELFNAAAAPEPRAAAVEAAPAAAATPGEPSDNG
jgi:hypothetical protein